MVEEKTAVLIEPATILEEIQEDEPFQKKLRLSVSLCRLYGLLVFFEIALDGFQRLIETLEKVLGQRLFVESFVVLGLDLERRRAEEARPDGFEVQ
ncbi:MAG TPA: hypothetical protein VKM93_28805 [Terriglobia bacterium]|nr:hypothetical protein [Terriglobia bacterium]